MKWIIFLVLIVSCSSEKIIEPIETISGRYQSEDMILLLDQSNSRVEAVLEWSGYSTYLIGKYDKINKQVIMNGNYFGNQNISFNLIYGNQSLAGCYNYNGNGSIGIHFIFVNKLSKSIIHNQGRIQ